MNVLILSGRLGKDPERKHFNGSSVVNFTLAETIVVNGEKKAAWHDCECWGKISDTIERYCQKGTQITLTGSLRYDEYESKDGRKVKRAKVNIHNIEITAGWREQATQQPGNNAVCNGSEVEDDLPF